VQTNLTGVSSSPASDPASNQTAAVSALTLPGPVSGLSATTTKYNIVTIQWTALTGISQYKVLRGTTTAGNYADAFVVATNNFVNNAATNAPVYPGVGYHYAVVAVNATGSSPGTPTDLPVTTPAAPWSPSSSGLGGGWINAIAADPTTSGAGIVYAATGLFSDVTTAGGIFKFNPGPSTWAPANNGIPNGTVITSFAFDVVVNQARSIFAGTRGNGVFVSSDNGSTWRPLAAAGLGNGTVSALFEDRNRILWAGGDGSTGGGIYSLNVAAGATTWAPSLSGPTQTVQAFAQDLNTPLPDIWAELGAGKTAVPAGGLYHFSGTWALDPNQPPGVGATDCSLTRSDAAALAIDSNPATSVLYWGSKSCGLLSRPVTPVTAAWSVVVGYTATEITRLVVVDPDPKIWVASAEPTAANNGVTFIQPNAIAANQKSHMPSPYAGNNWIPTALESDPRLLRARLWGGSSDGTGAYLSTNATTSPAPGGTFTQANSGLSNFNVRYLFSDPDNLHLVVAGDQIGVATSANAGNTWTTRTLSGCNSVVSLTYNTGNGIAFATCQGAQGVYVGTGNGTTWTLKPCTGLLPATPTYSRGMAIRPGATDTLYFATQGSPATIWRTDASTTGGGNPGNVCTAVAALPPGITNVSAIGVDAAGDLFAGSPANFVYTLGSGATSWVAGITGAKGATGFFVDSSAAETIYTAGQDTTTAGGVWKALTAPITSTTTASWTTVPASPTMVTASSFVTGFSGLVPNAGTPPLLFAGTALTTGQQYANVFLNSGGSWTAAGDGITGGNVFGITLPNGAGVAATPNFAMVLAGSSGGGIFKTTSGGQ
jgi:hypothetical protein